MDINISKDIKKEIINSIQAYFHEERDDEIGDLAAELLLDFFLEQIGPHFYNQGVHDAKDMVMDRMLSMEVDLEALKRPIR
ncbi:hypothetical protein CIB95_12705 [Lottiidibacillus patelloidae]|uniref:DUF2164 domain-containing protein n=1 Tax=Lottiidibacillus patelloidae TaxID=2670334 RepID=A0A263BSD1_9BACI|nr:DUF2164 domain-containing protein [Lottiidibacillus patelloidae]OZM56277.1 hypothetical protein CIB95_12705 [Lottiidibacillus patelloidae]